MEDIVTCILRIEDRFNEFQRDLKVELPLNKVENPTYDDILSGISEKILSKYIENMKEDTAIIHLMKPMVLEKKSFIHHLEQMETKRATKDIDDILSGFSDEKKQQILAHLEYIRKKR